MTKFIAGLIAYWIAGIAVLALDSTVIMIGLNGFGYPIGYWQSVGLGAAVLGAAGIAKFGFDGVKGLNK